MNYRRNLLVSAGLFVAIIFAFPFSLGAEEENRPGVPQAGTWGVESGKWGNAGKAPAFDPSFQEQRIFPYPSIHSVGFVKKRPVAYSGAIFKAKENREMISKRDQVYIREKGEESLIIGRHYTTYRILKTIKEPHTHIEMGFQHFLTGVVEITEKHPRFAVGRVIRSFRDIALNDFLMPYLSRAEKIPVTESVEGLEGKIIGAEDEAEIMGTYTIVFIDKGEQDGVTPGQEYNIFYQEKALLDPQRSEEKIKLPPVDFGRMIVLHVEHAVSTALITQADKAIHIGARFRSSVR